MINKQAHATDNVSISVYNLDGIDKIEPRWPQLSDRAKMKVLTYLKPDISETSSNTTTIELDEARALQMDPTRDVDDKPQRLAVGTSTTSTDYEDRSLNNEIGRTTIEEFEVSGTTIIMNAFLGRSQLNEDNEGNLEPELTELGVISQNDRLFNHSLFNSFVKTPQRGVQFQVSITFDTA